MKCKKQKHCSHKIENNDVAQRRITSELIMLNRKCKQKLISCQAAKESMKIELGKLRTRNDQLLEFMHIFPTSDNALENEQVRTKHCARVIVHSTICTQDSNPIPKIYRTVFAITTMSGICISPDVFGSCFFFGSCEIELFTAT